MNTLSVGGALRFAWVTFKKRPFILIGGYVLATAVSVVASALLDTEGMDPLSPVAIVMLVASIAIGILIELGIVTFALKAHDNIEALGMRDLWNPKPFWRYLGGQVVVSIIVLLGLILLIVPGIIAAIALFAVSYLIVDKGIGPIKAVKESYRITKDHWFTLFLLTLMIIALNIIGFLVFVVGLVVTIPLSMLAMAHAYRVLERGSAESSTQEAEESIAVS